MYLDEKKPFTQYTKWEKQVMEDALDEMDLIYRWVVDGLEVSGRTFKTQESLDDWMIRNQ